MESKELIEYIKSQINNKVSKEEITKILQEQGGWADKDITDAFSVVEQNQQNQNPEVEKVEEKPEAKKEQTEIQPETFEKKPSNHSFQIVAVIIILAIISIGGYFGVKHFSTPTDLDEPVTDEVEDDGIVEQIQENQEVKNEIASSTEQELSSDYEIKDKGVYYGGELIEGADSETFMVLSDLFLIDSPSGYAKDKSKVYYKRNEIIRADVKSFVLIQPFISDYDGGIVETGMAQDINNKYYLGRRVVDRSIIDKLENLGDYYYKDGVNVYRDMRYSSGLHALFMPVVLDQFDTESFEFVDFCWYMPGSGSYHESYVKDKNNVFCGEEKLEKADPSTFEVVGSLEEGEQDAGIYFFSKDKNNVYLLRVVIEGADPANCTAENLEGCKGN